MDENEVNHDEVQVEEATGWGDADSTGFNYDTSSQFAQVSVDDTNYGADTYNAGGYEDNDYNFGATGNEEAYPTQFSNTFEEADNFGTTEGYTGNEFNEANETSYDTNNVNTIDNTYYNDTVVNNDSIGDGSTVNTDEVDAFASISTTDNFEASEIPVETNFDTQINNNDVGSTEFKVNFSNDDDDNTNPKTMDNSFDNVNMEANDNTESDGYDMSSKKPYSAPGEVGAEEDEKDFKIENTVNLNVFQGLGSRGGSFSPKSWWLVIWVLIIAVWITLTILYGIFSHCVWTGPWAAFCLIPPILFWIAFYFAKNKSDVDLSVMVLMWLCGMVVGVILFMNEIGIFFTSAYFFFLVLQVINIAYFALIFFCMLYLIVFPLLEVGSMFIVLYLAHTHKSVYNRYSGFLYGMSLGASISVVFSTCRVLGVYLSLCILHNYVEKAFAAQVAVGGLLPGSENPWDGVEINPTYGALLTFIQTGITALIIRTFAAMWLGVGLARRRFMQQGEQPFPMWLTIIPPVIVMSIYYGIAYVLPFTGFMIKDIKEVSGASGPIDLIGHIFAPVGWFIYISMFSLIVVAFILLLASIWWRHTIMKTVGVMPKVSPVGNSGTEGMNMEMTEVNLDI